MLKSCYLAKNRVIWQKNRVIWQKNRVIRKIKKIELEK